MREGDGKSVDRGGEDYLCVIKNSDCEARSREEEKKKKKISGESGSRIAVAWLTMESGVIERAATDGDTMWRD